MLFTLILKDIRITYRSILYSFFEIILVAVLFALIGYISNFGVDAYNLILFKQASRHDLSSSPFPYTERKVETIPESIERLKAHDLNDKNTLRPLIGYHEDTTTHLHTFTMLMDPAAVSTNLWTNKPGRDPIDFIMSESIKWLFRTTWERSNYSALPPTFNYMPSSPVDIKSNIMYPILQVFIVLVVVNITRAIVHEKATFRQYLVSMGLSIRTYYLAHFIFSYLKCILIFTPGLVFFAKWQKTTESSVYVFITCYLFILPAITFSFMIASWFKSQKGAILTCLVVWFSLNFVPYFTIGDDPEKLTSLAYVLPTSLIFTFNIFYIGQTMGTMGQFGDFSCASTTDRALPLYAFWIMLVVNAATMFAVAIAGDELLSSHVSLFTLLRKRNNNKPAKRLTSHEEDQMSQSTVTQDGATTPTAHTTRRSEAGADAKNDDGAFQDEAHRKTMESDIDIADCVKVYPTGEMAVKGLTMHAIRGQVSVLLGHNGCGKSSTFAMIAGMTRPTEGSIKVAGLDVVSNRSEARRMIGLCPQYNPLIDKLTVWEHLRIVHALKRADTDFANEAEQLLDAIKLTEKRETLAKNLSGGQKRKLCMLMALIGESCVVLLDEPTAGMDAASRQDVQTMLRATKTKRTILLTTHNMDEADKLADWLYVMSEGRIEASGDSQFLKTKFGGGWLVTVVVGDALKDSITILEVCKKFVPGSVIKETRGQMIELSVPADDKEHFIDMLKCLESISDKNFDCQLVATLPNIDMAKQLVISSIGVSLNSLEQVFINIIEQCEKNANKNRSVEQKAETIKRLLDKKEEAASCGVLSQFAGLSLKRLIYLRRNWIAHLLNILIPILILVAILSKTVGGDGVNAGATSTTRLDLHHLLPPASIVVVKTDVASSRIVAWMRAATSRGVVVKRVAESRSVADILKHEQFFHRIAMIVDCDATGDTATHVALNELLAKVSTIATYLKVKLSALPDIDATSEFDFQRVFETSKFAIVMLIAVNLIALAVFAILATYVISTCAFLHAEERVAKFKHQQFLTQMSPFIYWFSHYFWEFVLFMITIGGCIGCMCGFGMVGANTAMVFLAICSLTWLATAPIIFIISFMIDTSTKITLLVLTFCFFVPMVKIVADCVMGVFWDVKMLHLTRFIFPFQPFFSLLIFTFVEETISPEVMALFESAFHAFFFRQNPSMGRRNFDFVMLGVSALVYNLILILVCWRSVGRVLNGLFHSRHTAQPKIPLNMEPCQEVDDERKEIESSQLTSDNTTVLINEMVKRYGSYQAVNGVYLGVKGGECFGLLGVSGAGKSTMIEILTCKQFACSGKSTIGGLSVDGHVKLGYCPQFDAVLGDFTGRDLLKIMVCLQNYSSPCEMVDCVLECVGMQENADKRIKYCSGGQKRKISMGMAIISKISHGELIMLDEPTAGVDPKARRDLWDIIVGVRTMGQVGVMLTSHSMEECEALCTRIGILRKGDMIALGTHQDLKSKYGNTFTLTITIKEQNEKEKIVQKVQQTFGAKCTFLNDDDDQSLSLVWEIAREKGEKWSHKMEEVRKMADEMDVDNYYLVQSSLEDTFIKMNSPNIEKKEV